MKKTTCDIQLLPHLPYWHTREDCHVLTNSESCVKDDSVLLYSPSLLLIERQMGINSDLIIILNILV